MDCASLSQHTKPLVNIPGTPAPAATYTVRGRPTNPWFVLFSLAFGLFMSQLDLTIVNIAFTDIQARLHTDAQTVIWVLNAYSLTFAVLLVTFGRLADQYGRKRIFLLGMVLFSSGSLLCALAPSIGWLIGFRVLQAAGGAALNPISLAIITAVFPREKRGAAMGAWGALIGISSACGPMLGGILVQTFDWRSIFFVNLPFSIAGLVMVSLYVPETRDPNQSKRVDFPGVLTLTIAIFCLVLGLIQGQDWGWHSPAILSLFAIALASISLFVLVEIKQSEPMMDLSLFKTFSFSISNITMFLLNVAWQGPILLLVLYFQRLLGYNNLQAAYALLPVPLSSFVTSVLMGRLSTKFKFNYALMCVIGTTLYTLGLALYCMLPVTATALDTAWRSVLVGVGIGMTMQSLPNINLTNVPRAKLGVASGTYNTSRQLGLALSAAILLSIFLGQLTPNLATARNNSIAMVQADTRLPTRLRSEIVTGLSQISTNQDSSQAAKAVNLAPLAGRLPPQVPVQMRQAIRTELTSLGERITVAFQNQVLDAFKASWLGAAIAALLAWLSALVGYRVRN